MVELAGLRPEPLPRRRRPKRASIATPRAPTSSGRCSRCSRSRWPWMRAWSTSTAATTPTEPLQLGRHRIRDFHAKRRWLSVPEILAFSSNIGAAKMAHDAGQRAAARLFRTRFGLLDRFPIRAAGGRRAAVAVALAADQHRDRRLRPRHRRVAAADGGCGRGGVLCSAPRPRAHLVAGRGAAPCAAVGRGRDRRPAALADVADRGRRAPASRPRCRATWSAARPAAPTRSVAAAIVTAACCPRSSRRSRSTSRATSCWSRSTSPRAMRRTYNFAHGGWTAAPTVGRIIGRIGPLLGLPPGRSRGRAVVSAAPRAGPGGRRPDRSDRAELRRGRRGEWCRSHGGEHGCGCLCCSALG